MILSKEDKNTQKDDTPTKQYWKNKALSQNHQIREDSYRMKKKSQISRFSGI